jgi:hypothetical protein
MSIGIARTEEGKLVRKLPVIYDDVICMGKEMNIDGGVMYHLMKSPLVRTIYFAKNVSLHFMGWKHDHKTYIVRAR